MHPNPGGHACAPLWAVRQSGVHVPGGDYAGSPSGQDLALPGLKVTADRDGVAVRILRLVLLEAGLA